MQKNNYKIVAFRITKVTCEINLDDQKEPITINAEDKVSCNRSAEPEDKFGLFKLETVIASDDTELFVIKVESETVFEFDEVPSDFENVMQKGCYPLAREKAYTAIRDITAAMGITPVDLTKAEAIVD